MLMSKMKISIQGIEGSFHHEAARTMFGEDVRILPCRTFSLLCRALANNLADRGVMAIENTIAGSILPNYNLIKDNHLNIVGEHFKRIELHLMGIETARTNSILEVISHPMALHQTSNFINSIGAISNERCDTATAARDIAVLNQPSVAAIAGKEAAKVYGLTILEDNIESDKKNYTRFLVLSKSQKVIDGNKASIRLELGHAVGSLNKVLQVFEDHGINLTKIQSVPVKGKPRQYAFYIDLDWLNRAAYEQCMVRITRIVHRMDVLGVYFKHEINLN